MWWPRAMGHWCPLNPALIIYLLSSKEKIKISLENREKSGKFKTEGK